MMTRNPYTFENDDDNNTIDTNSVNADNRNVRKHKSLMNVRIKYKFYSIHDLDKAKSNFKHMIL